MKCTGIILAGGLSSRMGTDKSFVVYQSKYMIEYAIETFTSFCDEILISGNSKDLEQFQLPVIPDSYIHCGPLSGLYSACKVANFDVCVTVPCDLPHITEDLYQKMLQKIDGYDAVIPRLENGEIEPLAACFTKNVYLQIQKCIESRNFKVFDFLQTIRVYYFDVANASQFRNVNTKEDIL